MLLYNGEMGEPCGTPTFVGTTCPLTCAPTVSVCLISFSRLPSAIRLAISVISLRCGILVKYAWKSISTTLQARLYRSSRIAMDACLGSVRDVWICHAWHIHLFRRNPILRVDWAGCRERDGPFPRRVQCPQCKMSSG